MKYQELNFKGFSLETHSFLEVIIGSHPAGWLLERFLLNLLGVGT